jgi:hypothetical protein
VEALKTVGDEWKVRCHDPQPPEVGTVIAIRHRRTSQFTRKAQVTSVRGMTVRLVIVPLDTPHTTIWERKPR